MQPLRNLIRIALAVLTVSACLNAGTPGEFRGTIVEAPGHSSTGSWIYVQGRNGSARRVDISGAHVVYDEDVPAAERRSNPADALTVGTEVRVTAEQGSDGEWKASRIEILKTAVSTQRSAAGLDRLSTS